MVVDRGVQRGGIARITHPGIQVERVLELIPRHSLHQFFGIGAVRLPVADIALTAFIADIILPAVTVDIHVAEHDIIILLIILRLGGAQDNRCSCHTGSGIAGIAAEVHFAVVIEVLDSHHMRLRAVIGDATVLPLLGDGLQRLEVRGVISRRCQMECPAAVTCVAQILRHNGASLAVTRKIIEAVESR